MPIYSYKCKKCEKIFDKFQKPGANGNTKCESCNEEAIRIFSPVGIIFKGSGFYKTDYGSSTKAASGSPTDTKDKKKETKADSKKPEKTEAKAKPSATSA